MAMSVEMQSNIEIIWRGAGWYGPRSEGEITRWYKIDTDASQNNPFDASNDGWVQGIGTPDWYDSEDEFYA